MDLGDMMVVIDRFGFGGVFHACNVWTSARDRNSGIDLTLIGGDYIAEAFGERVA